MCGSWPFKKLHMRTSMRKLLLNFADLLCFRRKLGESLLCWNGFSPTKQELPVLQSGVPHSEPCGYRLWFGDCRFDWTDVWGEMYSQFFAFPSCFCWQALWSSLILRQSTTGVLHDFRQSIACSSFIGVLCRSLGSVADTVAFIIQCYTFQIWLTTDCVTTLTE